MERFQLDNGLRVVVSTDTANPIVAVNIWYNVGSRNERAGRTGFAHLFEHMMFQGSAHVPENAHFALIEKAGGSLNGSTWLDRTNYYETLPSNYLELALWLEADRMGWLLPAMTQQKLDNQRDVVKNERRWRVDNQPYGDWDERMQAMVFPEDHPYHHSVIGSMADLDAAGLSDIEGFFRTFYAPDNAVLTLVGDVDLQAARALAARYFGGIPRGPGVPAMPGRTQLPPTLDGDVRVEVEQDISLARVYVGYRTPAYGTDEYYAGAVAAYVLASGRASHLYRDLVRHRRLAQDVAAFAFPVVLGAGMLVVWATARPTTDVAVLERALDDEVSAVREATDDDVARAVNLLESHRLIELQRVDERADLLSMYTTLFDEPERINTEVARVRAVGRDDVRRFGESYLVPGNRAKVVYRPRKADHE
jgi:zinc protease